MISRRAVSVAALVVPLVIVPRAEAAESVQAELMAFTTEDPLVPGTYDASYNCTALADRSAVFTLATCELTDASGDPPLVTSAAYPGPFAIAFEEVVSGVIAPAELCAIAEAIYETDEGVPKRETDRLCRPLID